MCIYPFYTRPPDVKPRAVRTPGTRVTGGCLPALVSPTGLGRRRQRVSDA